MQPETVTSGLVATNHWRVFAQTEARPGSIYFFAQTSEIASRLHADGVVPDMAAIDAEKGATEADCVVIVTDHKDFDYARIVERSKLIVDTRNALKGNPSEKIVRL
jgi:UDP-N-acetyl-D-mannosaminuronate dehydrogenase